MTDSRRVRALWFVAKLRSSWIRTRSLYQKRGWVFRRSDEVNIMIWRLKVVELQLISRLRKAYFLVGMGLNVVKGFGCIDTYLQISGCRLYV